MFRFTGSAAIVILVAWAAASADSPGANAPTTAPAGQAKAEKTAPAENELRVTVVSVHGSAQKFDGTDPKAAWEKIQVGDVLGEGAIVRTGLGSKLVLKFADRGNVRVKSGTKMGIREFRKDGDLARTQLGLKYGSMRAKVDRSTGPNDFRIHTPVATLSVRGSQGHVSHSTGFGTTFHSRQSTWGFRTSRGKKSVPQGGSTDSNLTPTNEITARALDTKNGDPYGLGGGEAKNVRDNANPSDPFNPVGGTGTVGLITNPGLACPEHGDVPIPVPPSPNITCD